MLKSSHAKMPVLSFGFFVCLFLGFFFFFFGHTGWHVGC